MKRYIIIGACALLAACSQQQEIKENLAQCQMEALEPDGFAFRTNYLQGEAPQEDDASYREFMLLCMEAKGFEFQAPEIGEENDPCWLPDAEGIIPDAFVDNSSCYAGE